MVKDSSGRFRRAGSTGRWVPALAFVFGLGCAHSKIPNTEIDDTPDNRAVLSVVEAYKTAVESLDAEAVLALVSPRFFEDNGTSDASDDYGYDGLAKALRANFERTRVMQLNLRIVDVDVEGDEAFVELIYDLRSQVEYPAQVKWDTYDDTMRLRLVRVQQASWRIAAGL